MTTKFPATITIGRYVGRDGRVILYADGFPPAPTDECLQYVSIDFIKDLMGKTKSLHDLVESNLLERILLVSKMKDLPAANADDYRNALEAITDIVKDRITGKDQATT